VIATREWDKQEMQGFLACARNDKLTDGK
jgi:hypothetical protein